ncbi:hypothetical protein M407DRAFT_23478 [Tulasnella calospora MUT 4182]|uniref:Uncharacterized protein n=1 Tax=Tulasnella calospora MUT 4182 TaxID=1051891 RepID=A0A0C3QJK6_9AGAM|nr:hypothetical protein M407DRAFT_23478 [Tulasnella calospora MUT 4182]
MYQSQYPPGARPPAVQGPGQPTLGSQGYPYASPSMHNLLAQETYREKAQTQSSFNTDGYDSSSHSSRPNPVRKRTGDSLTLARANTTWSQLKSLLKPVAFLIIGFALAIGHHLFNNWADGRSVGASPSVPQVWVIRVGTAFAFAFHTILAACLGFVICQLLWFTTRRNYLTIDDINTLYLVERRDIVSTILSNAMRQAPLLVAVTLSSFLLPVASVFTPASLGVTDTPLNTEGPCVISAGDFSSSSGIQQGGIFLSGYTPTVQKFAEAAFYGGTIVPLPDYCGQNCTYVVNTDSFTFACQPNVALPDGQLGTFDPAHPGPGIQTFWNATLTGSEADHDPTMPFYVGWATGGMVVPFDSSIGSSGAVLCTPRQAHYQFQVQKFNGLQTVSYTMTPGDPMLGTMALDQNNQQPSTKAMRVGAVALATRDLLLGALSVETNPMEIVWGFNSTVRGASFLNIGLGDIEQFVWGDVMKGIEQTAANVTASLLNLDLGEQNSTCFYTQAQLVYTYHRPNLWAPYGIALFVVTLALVFGAVVFLRYNPDNMTTSFINTVGITRNRDLDVFARLHGGGIQTDPALHSAKFRLGDMGQGRIGYGASQKFEL